MLAPLESINLLKCNLIYSRDLGETSSSNDLYLLRIYGSDIQKCHRRKLLGTLEFLAPLQIKSEVPDSLGITFDGDVAVEVAGQ